MHRPHIKTTFILFIVIALILICVFAGFAVGRVNQKNDNSGTLSDEERIPPDRKPEDYYFTLGYMPEGFEIYEVQSSRNRYFNAFINDENEKLYFYVEKGIIPQQFFINTENAKIKHMDINGNKAILSSNSIANILVWIEGNRYRFNITGTIDEKTMKKIAENIE